MKLKTIILIISSLFAFNIAVGSNNNNKKASIEGHVIDAKTKEAIAYANIGIVGTRIGVSSNSDGNFILRGLKEGHYVLKATFVGYKPKEIDIYVDGKSTTHAHFELEESSIMIEEVVVSANRNEVSRKEAPVIVNVVSNKNFQSTNAQDLSQALSFQSGVRVEYNCQSCGVPQVRLNGLEGPYTQMLIDSRPIMSSLSGIYGLEQIPTNMVERIEVVKGGGSALYGANAIAGTINIITKEANKPSFSVSNDMQMIGMKSFADNFNFNGALVNSDNTSGVSFYQTMRKRNPFDANGDGITEIGKLNSWSMGTKIYHKPTPTQKITLEYHTTEEKRRGGNKFEVPIQEADVTEMTDYMIHSGSLNYDFITIDGKHKVSAYTSTQYVDRDSYFGTHQDPNAFGKSQDLTFLIGTQATNHLDKLLFSAATLTYGVEYNINHLEDEMIGYNRHINQSVGVLGGYFQSEWTSKYFNVLIGGRLDKHNLIKNPIFSPRVNLMYKPSADFQLRASYAKGYRAPQTYDEDLHVMQVGGEAVLLRNANNLKQEVSNSFSISADYYYQISDDFQTNILIESFYTDINNAFALRDLGHDDENNAVIKERYNAKGARIGGISATAKIAYQTKYALTLGYTIQRNEYKEIEFWSEDETVDGTKHMMRTPNNYGFLTLTSQPIKPLNISLTGTYTGKMYVPHYQGYIEEDRLEITPNFFDLNLTGSYDFKISKSLTLTINAGIKNIFNSYQKDFDKGIDRDAGYIYGPMQPRTIFAGIKISSR